MMDTVGIADTRLRWLRAFVAGFLAEVVLSVIAAPVIASTTDAVGVLSLIIPPLSFLIFIGAGYWSAKPVPSRGVLQGALAGIMAVALYVVLLPVAWAVVPGANPADSLSVAYIAAHALKIAGAALGGWLVARKVRAGTPV